MTHKFSLSLSLAVSLLLLVAGCASGYKQFYQPAKGATPLEIAALRAAPPSITPIVEHSQPVDDDGQSILKAYAKRSYVMIGQSAFNSGSQESEDSAVRQGQEVGADLVLILNPKYTGSVTSIIPITTPTTNTSYSSGSATAYGPGGPVTAYGTGTTTTYGSTTNFVPVTVHRSDYAAIFFVKRRVSLGAFTRELNDAERQEFQSNKGAVVHLVVDGSPAFDADILVGDVIMAIDGKSVSSTKTLQALLREHAGKLIAVSIVRRGQHIEKSVKLNL